MKNKKKIVSLINLFYIFLGIIWQPFQIYILKVDGAGRTILFLSIVALVLSFPDFYIRKRDFLKPAFLCWVLLLCYSMCNSFAKGFYYEEGTLLYLRSNFLDTFILLIIMMLELNKNKRIGLYVIWIALGVYLLIGLPYFSADLEGRTTVEGIKNLYPLHAVTMLFVSSLLFKEGQIKFWIFLVLTVGISAIIFLSGTRKAFGAEIIILLGVALNNGKKRSVKSWIKLLAMGVLLALGVKYAMEHTFVGERLSEDTDEVFYVDFVENQRVNDIINDALGDRAIQYEYGIEMFHEHFWTGIGLTNYTEKTYNDIRLHTEYIVQLCENGIIGFVLLILFYALLIIALIRNRKTIGVQTSNVTLFGLISVLFISFTAWTYNMSYIMIFYAIFMMNAYFNPEKPNISDENTCGG